MRQAITTAAVLCGLLASMATAWGQAPPPFLLTRGVWSFDRSNIKHYDAKKIEQKRQAGIMNEMSGWAEYDFAVPADGWYELYFKGGVPGWTRDVFVDGVQVVRQGTAARADQREKDVMKEINLFLTRGAHTLRIRRLNFPGVLPGSWELRAAGDDPAGSITAVIAGFHIKRLGEKLTLTVTGGAPVPTTYELYSIGRLQASETLVGTVSFPAATHAITKTLAIPCTAEGVYTLEARVHGKALRPNDLHAGAYAVIDTKQARMPATLQTTLIHEIDCVQQTDNGTPISKDEAFWEVTEPTRVVTTAAGTYREGGDGTDPHLPYPPGAPAWRKYNSGFSYAIDVPAPQELYLLEVEYPDDDRRTVNVFVAEPEKTMPCQLYGGYETGDWFALSNTMHTEKILFWARGTKVRAAILSKNPGMRAAAAKMRVYRVEGGLPPGPAGRRDGRLLTHWMEESTRWLQHAVPSDKLDPLAKDFTAIERYVQLCRYHGFNAVSPTEAIYQGMTYYSDELEGWFVQPYDAVRIVALMCEKYGMKYIPELHISGQAWFHSEVVEKLVDNPDDLYIYSRLGTNAKQGGSWFSSTWNPLHPAIQEKYIRILGELTDKVADSPAFGGVSCRLMSWVWQGWNGLPSLNWGYGDWDMQQFATDTGVRVPGAAADPERFQQRFAFLTAPEMLSTWMAWREGRMLAYYRRMRDRIRKQRPDAVLYLPYYGNASAGMDLTFGSFFGTEKGALREVGINLDVMAKEPGICVLPSGGYGRRDLGNVIADAGVSDSIANPDKKELGFAYERAFGFGNAYFEDQVQVHVSALGLPELPDGRGNNGAAEGAGRNVLEKLAYALADGDTGMMRQGGMGYTFGRPDEYRAWLAEYVQLPKLPFTALQAARDPVAVWYRDHTDGFYFYAVNREPYAVTITLSLAKAGALRALGSGQTLAMTGGKLALTLAPFELRAFQAKRGAVLTGAETVVAPEHIALVRDRLAFCQRLAREISTGARRNDISAPERNAFLAQVEIAWQAVEARHWWRARTALSSAPAITVFQQLASWPEGQLYRRMGIGLLATENRSGTEPAAAPMQTAEQLQPRLQPGGDAVLVESSAYNPSWLFAKVLQTARGVIDIEVQVPVPGRYRLSLGHVATQPGAMTVAIGGRAMAVLAETRTPGQPERTVFPAVTLPAGNTLLSVRGQGSFGIYGVTLQPIYRPAPSPHWLTIGPFTTKWYSGAPGGLVKEAMLRIDPPQRARNFTATYPGDGKQVGWTQSAEIRGGVPHFDELAGVSFLFRARVQEKGVCFAVTHIISPDERDAEILIGCDWWANAWLNDEALNTDRPAQYLEEDGCAFNGWRPLVARVHLKKGVNELLVKSHGGTVANWFTCYVSDPGDLTIQPRP